MQTIIHSIFLLSMLAHGAFGCSWHHCHAKGQTGEADGHGHDHSHLSHGRHSHGHSLELDERVVSDDVSLSHAHEHHSSEHACEHSECTYIRPTKTIGADQVDFVYVALNTSGILLANLDTLSRSPCQALLFDCDTRPQLRAHLALCVMLI